MSAKSDTEIDSDEETTLLTPKPDNSIKFNTEFIVICLVAFTNGIVGLADLAISYMFKDDYGMSPAIVSMLGSMTALPWIVKPVWGFISDTYPILGYRRKPYLAIFGVLGALGWVLLGFAVHSFWLAIITLMFIQTSLAFCNVIGEALVVE
jgi:MFS family permease